MPDDAWRDRLKREVPREEIPVLLSDLQRLVAALRRFRDDLRVPVVADVEPLLTPTLRAYPGIVVGYLGDVRYAAVVESALGG